MSIGIRPRIEDVQIVDRKGNPIVHANDGTKIKGNGTFTIFTGRGVFIQLAVWQDHDGGSLYFTDENDLEIGALPFSDFLALTDWGGTMPARSLLLTNGLKVVVADAANFRAIASFFKAGGTP